jgi:hypothetical protein
LLQVHGEALDSVRDLTGDRIALDPANLLEVGELRDLHAVQPHFPPQAPGAQRLDSPIVLDETDVVVLEVEAQGFERAQVELENIPRRWLEHDLVLVVVLHPVGIVAVAAILRTARGLHVRGLPGLRPSARRNVAVCDVPAPTSMS